MTLSGSKIFAAVVSQGSGDEFILNVGCPPEKKRGYRETRREGGPHEDGNRDWSDATSDQGANKKARKEYFLEPLGVAQACSHLAFWNSGP